MFNSAFSYACLAATIMLAPISIATFYHISKGSQSRFAYLLIIFTFIDAIGNAVWFIMNLYPTEINVEGTVILLPNRYALYTNDYLF